MNRIILTICIVAGWLLSQANIVGGDISLLPSYEAKKAKYYDINGKSIPDMLPWLKEQGWTAIRVRLFVDPSKAPSTEIGEGVCQDLDYVKLLGARIKSAGFKFLLDFHYSDSWADPAKQYTPDAWKDLTDEQLYDTIYQYTCDCLQTLVDAGAAPDYIQTGNEISYGMLWGARGTATSQLKKFNTGNSNNDNRFLQLLRQANKACREVCPNAKIIVHTELVRNITIMNNYYRAIAGIDYDIIGLSYYPYYHYSLKQLDTALLQIETNFPSKEVMIVETGFYNNWQPSNINYDYSTTADSYGNTYAITPEGQRAFTAALVAKLLEHPVVTGLFWWWPEANEYGVDWHNPVTSSGWYNAGLWNNNNGRVFPAFYELAAFAPAEEPVEGDVDGDGKVDVSDVNAAINIILELKVAADYPGDADLVSDGKVDISDVNAIINIILS
ncbi:MAG: glycosyl hydrolase 53 family protein [Muribaculaceae bacterium]|nr:glycosyl hydrolase 53 family protein [Muribaculaceae bacterium]